MYQVIWTYDGCPDKNATVPMDTVPECKDFIRRYVERHSQKFSEDPKLGLDILDLCSNRLISYVL